jgi:hypothetical protein
MPRAGGQGARDAVRQQVCGVEGRRAGRGGDRDQDAEPERAAELVGGVDQPGCGAASSGATPAMPAAVNGPSAPP